MNSSTDATEPGPGGVGLIRILQPGIASSFRLVFFPESAESIAYYLSLAELLLPTVEVLVVQYPVAAGGDAGARTTDDAQLADRIFEALGEWTDGPVALFGHRAGADLAFRVAERWERDCGTAVLTLFVSARAARLTLPLGPPTLGCRVVALVGEHTPDAPRRGVRGWRRCTSGRFDLEVLPDSYDYLDSCRREIVNLVHDQLLSQPPPDAE
ncbi:thioesterase II family protein [Kitasatospora mediocidica]|uniref:thioesterase II family protein n=1 Tax=Kitasatospora mediocidica TaxID=58352 RepID=UPI0005644E0D|nr:thioesterase domain-containing protein [Kitasatospora mediocidica]